MDEREIDKILDFNEQANQYVKKHDFKNLEETCSRAIKFLESMKELEKNSELKTSYFYFLNNLLFSDYMTNQDSDIIAISNKVKRLFQKYAIKKENSELNYAYFNLLQTINHIELEMGLDDKVIENINYVYFLLNNLLNIPGFEELNSFLIDNLIIQLLEPQFRVPKLTVNAILKKLFELIKVNYHQIEDIDELVNQLDLIAIFLTNIDIKLQFRYTKYLVELFNYYNDLDSIIEFNLDQLLNYFFLCDSLILTASNDFMRKKYRKIALNIGDRIKDNNPDSFDEIQELYNILKDPSMIQLAANKMSNHHKKKKKRKKRRK